MTLRMKVRVEEEGLGVGLGSGSHERFLVYVRVITGRRVLNRHRRVTGGPSKVEGPVP